jgi:APA family basic amino acid/polyamine antiporter
VLGVFKLRTRGMLAYRMPGFPVVPVFYVLTGVLILVLGFLQSPGPSLVALGTVALGVPAYFMFKTSKDIRGGLFYTQNKQGPP